MGTVAKMVDAGELVGDPNAYRHRETDAVWEFFNVDKEEYLEKWRGRDEETLSKSTMTQIPLVMREILSKVTELQQNDPHLSVPKVVVNIHPYKLSDEVVDMLLSAMAIHAGEEYEYRHVSIPPQALTPQYIRSNWKIVLMYDFWEWLEHHFTGLVGEPTRSVAMYVPKLRTIRDMTLEEYMKEEDGVSQQTNMEDINPFVAFQMLLCEHLDVEFMCVDEFSEIGV
jgi:hypothetical protein